MPSVSEAPSQFLEAERMGLWRGEEYSKLGKAQLEIRKGGRPGRPGSWSGHGYSPGRDLQPVLRGLSWG